MDPTASDTPPSGANETETSSGRTSGLKDRGKWANKTEFRLAMAGEIIGLGYLWRLPLMCYLYGGGAFLLPYFVMLFFFGMPVFFLETALGQYTGEGGVTSWRKICPMFQGIGIASQIIVMYRNVCSIVCLAWTLFYLYNSFKNPFPWSSCDIPGVSDDCWNQSRISDDWSFLHNISADYNNVESNYTWSPSPEEQFWNVHVGGDMNLSKLDLGRVHWKLALCLLLAWVACYFCIWKGVKCIGKVVYFTVAFPFLLLFILFIRGVSLPGAWIGIWYFLFPDFSSIAYPYVWYNAATQVLYSFAMSQGVLTAIGSYNEYKHDCYNDCLVLCALNSVTSIFGGLTLFSLLGFAAHNAGISMNEIIQYDITVLFISCPKVFPLLPGAQFWAVLFFLMVFFMGLDSQFLCVESFVTTITDMFPHTLRRPGFHEVLVLITVMVCFLLGLPLVTKEGLKVFLTIDTYGVSGTALLFIAGFETFVIGWIYGANRFYDNIEDMIGYQPFPVLKYCWMFVTPIVCSAAVIYSMINNFGSYQTWLTAVSAVMMLAPIMCIPVFILVAICKDQDGVTTPASDLRQACPYKPRLTLCEQVIVGGHKPAHNRADEEKPTAESSTGV